MKIIKEDHINGTSKIVGLNFSKDKVGKAAVDLATKEINKKLRDTRVWPSGPDSVSVFIGQQKIATYHIKEDTTEV